MSLTLFLTFELKKAQFTVKGDVTFKEQFTRNPEKNYVKQLFYFFINWLYLSLFTKHTNSIGQKFIIALWVTTNIH